ncbi:MAG TPA: PhoH family protein, partial [bacterium]|nr:PhoH family protein [bacterium]
IVGIALALKNRGENVRFISKDINVRIKADALGLIAEDFETNKINIEELYSGWTTITVKDAEVDEFYKTGKLALDAYLGAQSLYENQFLLLKSDIHEGKTALAVYKESLKQAQPLWFKDPEAWGIKALNREQHFALNLLLNDRISMVTLVGSAGTGKTLLALAAGLLKSLDEKKYRRVLVSRPIVPMGKDIGYLPGTKDEKLMNWMQPIFDNLEFILDKGHLQSDSEDVDDKVQYLLDSHKLELEALTYIRGRSIPKQFMIIDEAQNLTPHEIKTIVSRAGVGTKIIMTGDPYQIDNPYLDSSSNGIVYLAERFKGQEIFGHITLSKSERSPLAALAAKTL